MVEELLFVFVVCDVGDGVMKKVDRECGGWRRRGSEEEGDRRQNSALN